MPTLLLPKEEVIKALDVYSYTKHLRENYDIGAADVLAKAVYQAGRLTADDYAPVLEDGQKMAGFVEGLLSELPEQITEAFRMGWNPHGIERGRVLIDKFVSAAAALPEGPFFYLLASAYGKHRLGIEGSDAHDWKELFSGSIYHLLSGRGATTPALQIASERLRALADIVVEEEKVRPDRAFHYIGNCNPVNLTQRALEGSLAFMSPRITADADDDLRALKQAEARHASAAKDFVKNTEAKSKKQPDPR